MIVSSHQPCLLPWPGFWHRALASDLFLLSTGVDFSKDGFINRIRHDGAWLTVPIELGGSRSIRDMRIGHDERMLRKATKTIAQVTGPFAERRLTPIFMAFEEKAKPGAPLTSLTMPLLLALRDALGSARPIFKEVPLRSARGSKSERLYNRLSTYAPHARIYLCGRGTAEYLEPEILAPVRVTYQTRVAYPQERSILRVLAEEPDPIDWILSRAAWASSKEAA